MQIYNKYEHLNDLFNGGKGYHMNPETKTFYVTPQEQGTYVTPTFGKFESIKKMIERLNSDKPIDDIEVFKKEIWSPFELEKITNEQVQKVVHAFNTKTVETLLLQDLKVNWETTELRKLTINEFITWANTEFQSWKVELYNPKEYVQQRLKQMELSENTIELIDKDGKRIPTNIIAYNPKGHMVTRQFSLDRKILYNKYNQPAIQIRFNPIVAEKLCEKCNYGMSINYPMYPPQIIYKFENQIPIPILYITEGSPKGLVASSRGMDTIGLGSITYHTKKEKYIDENGKEQERRSIHPDIIRLCKACKTHTIVFLVDGDCKNISVKSLQQGEEMSKRPNNFYSAACTIAKYIKEEFPSNLNQVKTYFATIQSDKIEGKPKGIDDLFIVRKDKTQEIINEMQNIHLNVSNDETFLHWIYIGNEQGKQKLKEYLTLHDVNVFYQRHKEIIQNQKFKFHGRDYQYNQETQKVEQEQRKTVKLNEIMEHKMKKDFEIKEDDYIFINNEQNPGKIYQYTKQYDREYNYSYFELVPKNMETLKRKIGSKQIDWIIKNRELKGTTIVPSYTDYKQIIDEKWNAFAPLSYTPKKGEFDIYTKIFKHAMNNSPKKYSMFLDALTLLVKKPKQKLPTICFVSKKQSTGKTMVLLALQYLFQNNMVIIGGHKFLNGKSNKKYMTKQIVGINDINKLSLRQYEYTKEVLDREKVEIEELYSNGETIPCHVHFFLTSNNEKNLAQFEEENETRLWINKVLEIKERIDINEIKKLLTEQAPAFFYYLMNREIEYKLPENGDSRFFFDPRDYNTKQKQIIEMNTIPNIAKDFILRAYEYFLWIETMDPEFLLKYNIPIDELHISTKEMIEIWKMNVKTRAEINSLMKTHFPQIQKVKNPTNYNFLYERYDGKTMPYKGLNQRFFVFNKEEVFRIMELLEE